MHISIWTLLMASSMQAALHMDPSYAKYLEIFKNSELEKIDSLFNITRMMIGGNSKIKTVFSADAASPLWEKSTLLNDQALKWTKAIVYVCSDSGLCLGKTCGPEDAIKRWEEQVSTLKLYHTSRELQGLDGEPIDFEWTRFPGATAMDFLHKIQEDLEGKHITPKQISVIESSSCPCSTTLIWTRKEMKILPLPPRGKSKSVPQDSMTDTGHSWDPEKTASGIKDMQSIVAANGIFVLDKWWKISRIRDTQYSKE